jgi:hypothetical protein
MTTHRGAMGVQHDLGVAARVPEIGPGRFGEAYSDLARPLPEPMGLPCRRRIRGVPSPSRCIEPAIGGQIARHAIAEGLRCEGVL